MIDNLKLRIGNLKLSLGTAFMVTAVTLLACQQILVKLLPHVPIYEIVFFRALISFFISTLIMIRNDISFKGQNYSLLIVRGIIGSFSLLTFFYSLQNIPLATAVTIGQLSPIFLGMLAVIFLNERMSSIQWIALLISFSGVLLIKGFDIRITGFELSIAIFSAVLTALAHFTIRLLRNESPLTVLLYFSLIMMIVMMPFLIFQWRNPSKEELIYLLLVGVISHYAQLFLTKALKVEKIATINGIYYLGIALSVIAGLVIFNETFNLESIIGMLLILIGVLFGYLFKTNSIKE